MDTIITRSRKLEQFFYSHGVDFLYSAKDDDGMTIWAYERNAENEQIVERFKLGIARRAEQKGV